MFNMQVISDQESFAKMRGEWNHLLQKSRTNTLFLTWEWVYTWWTVYRENSELFIITARNKDGELIALAPLLIRKARYYRFPVREVVFIGTGISDSQDFIIATGNTDILESITGAIYENSERWDIVRLEEIPGVSPLSSNLAGEGFSWVREACSSSPYLPLAGIWQDYFKTLSKKFKRDLKNKENRMSRFGNFEYSFCCGWNDDVESLVNLMVEIDGRSRKEGPGISFYASTNNRDFMGNFVKLAKDMGCVDFTSVSLNGCAIAYLLGFQYNNTYIAYNMAFSEDFHEASPGKLLLHEKIKWCFDSTGCVGEFNFSRGASYIKKLWTTEVRQQVRIVFFKNTLYSQLIRHAVFTIRPAIKAFIKVKVGDTQKGKNVQEVD
jgi:CelD/BcsL family acetyltransferase involved in cellulose biosynthesis